MRVRLREREREGVIAESKQCENKTLQLHGSTKSSTHLVGFICGSLHLLINPTLELIRVTEKLLQVERVLQGGTAGLGAVVQSIAPAQQLKRFGFGH